MQIVQQGGIGIPRKTFRKVVNTVEQRDQIGLWIGCRHSLHCGIQIRERFEQIFFQYVFHKEILYAFGWLTNESFRRK